MHDFRVAHGATEILLIRHADAAHPQREVASDIKEIDLPLTERGRAQAQLLARRLTARNVNGIYSSPLKRALETAAPAAEALGLHIHADRRLREVEIGEVGSISLTDLAEIAIARGGWSHLPGTEPSTSIRARIADAVATIVTKHPGERIAVISHAGAINAYVAMLLGLEKDFFFPAGNTSISVIRARDDKRLIVTLNDTAHLERGA